MQCLPYFDTSLIVKMWEKKKVEHFRRGIYISILTDIAFYALTLKCLIYAQGTVPDKMKFARKK
jgi:hypothetical protein